jgi:hypothetical protein
MLAGVGCGRKPAESVTEKLIERAIEKGQGGDAKVDISEQGMTIKTKEGEFVAGQGEAVKLPADFPGDVFVYPKAKPIVTAKTATGFMVHFQTADAVEQIIARYGEEMAAKGWEQESSMNSPQSSMLRFTKENRTAALVVTRQDQNSRLMLTVSVPKQ